MEVIGLMMQDNLISLSHLSRCNKPGIEPVISGSVCGSLGPVQMAMVPTEAKPSKLSSAS